MSKVVLILGAGPNLGKNIANRFRDGGYKVAMAARGAASGRSEDGIFHIKADLSEPSNAPSVFRNVEHELGTPNIVVYNGRSHERSMLMCNSNLTMT